MVKINIIDVEKAAIPGVRAMQKGACEAHQEQYFRYTGLPLVCGFQTGDIAAGVLESWHHEVKFTEAEYHDDSEMFYFMEGTALMMFIEINEGTADMESAKIVRIRKDTVVIVEKGVGHFVPVAEDDRIKALVISPVQDAPKIKLADVIAAK